MFDFKEMKDWLVIRTCSCELVSTLIRMGGFCVCACTSFPEKPINRQIEDNSYKCFYSYKPYTMKKVRQIAKFEFLCQDRDTLIEQSLV